MEEAKAYKRLMSDHGAQLRKNKRNLTLCQIFRVHTGKPAMVVLGLLLGDISLLRYNNFKSESRTNRETSVKVLFSGKEWSKRRPLNCVENMNTDSEKQKT